MTIYAIITLNVLFGGLSFKDATLGDIIQAVGMSKNGDAAVENLQLMTILNYTTTTCAVITTIWHVYGVLTTTECRPRVAALTGLIPVGLWWFVIYCIFGCTEVGWQFHGAVYIGLVPLYSLLTQRQIICCMSRQPQREFAFEPLLFAILPLNRYLALGADEGTLLCGLLALTTLQFFWFVVGTIY
jgi:hypothetical protein